MSDLAHFSAVQEPRLSRTRCLRERIPLLSLLRQDLTDRPIWLQLVLVVTAIAGVAYADHLVVSLSLVYLYTLPLTIGAVFLRKEISYALIMACILFHYFFHSLDSPRHIQLGLRIFHDLSALLCLTFVVYVIQRYTERQDSLVKTVRQQRDSLLRDVELAAQVQRLFLPLDGPSISGLGVPAALLMSATAAVMRLEANRDRNILELAGRLNAEIYSVSDDEHYVTLLLAEVDAHKRTLRYVNCGHNPALFLRANTGTLTRLNSSCPPIGLFSEEICEQASVDLTAGDVLVFYTDGVTEAENQTGEEFGMERLSAAVRNGSTLSAEGLMSSIYNAVADFCGDHFNDDATILVVKCNFDGSSPVSS